MTSEQRLRKITNVAKNDDSVWVKGGRSGVEM
jgi:hypothetical protein